MEEVIKKSSGLMKKAIEHLNNELVRIRAGKASPQILDGIMVDYYNNMTPLNQVANIQVIDARTLSIQPWEKPMLAVIERAIMQANIGITPQNDGEQIRLYMPPLTEDRRKELAKKVYAEGEHAKVSVRNARRDGMEDIKKLQKDGLSEDVAKEGESRVQGLTDKYSQQIDDICKNKEKELMTV